MVSTADVPSLITSLCQSFISTPNPFYMTRATRRQIEEKLVISVRSKVFDCLLFDYDEQFSAERMLDQVEEVRAKVAAEEYGTRSSEQLSNIIGKFTGTDEDLSLLSLLLLLAGSVKCDPLPLLGYGDPPPLQLLSKDLLDEEEIFRYTPLLAPPDSRDYTCYTPFLFADSALTVFDSAFSDVSSVAASFNQSTFTLCDPGSYAALPSTSDGAYYSEAEKTEKSCQSSVSLYGALTNPYTSNDLQSLLELPSIDAAPMQFDYIQHSQTSSRAQYDDSNNVSTHRVFTESDERPDSGLGGDMAADRLSTRSYPQPMSWELKRRCGGFLGCDLTEKPYLTEAGVEVFDLLYRLGLSCQQQIEATRHADAIKHLYQISMSDLMSDVSILLVGVSSKCFLFDQDTDSYSIKKGLVVSGLSCQSLAGVCQVLVDAGTYYYRLKKLSEQQVPGLTIMAFLRSIANYLATYTAAVLNVSPRARSPLHMSRLLKKHLQQIRFLASLCHCMDSAVTEYPSEDFPDGIDLLSYIYKETENYNCHHTYHLMLSLLYDTSQPYLRFLKDWVFHGRCSDPFEEFIIVVDPYRLESQDRNYWTKGYLLDEQRKSKCLFMGSISDQIYLGGKSLALLRRIAPEHDILMAGSDSPNIDICLTEEQQQHITTQSSVYIERVREMVKHKLYTRKMMLEERELKRMELIKQAQAMQAKRLAAIYKKINEKQQRESQKKKQYYAELKENMEAAAARKTQAEKEEKGRDAEMVNKLAKREQLQTEADERLEQQARDELLEYYRLLSETAAARERRALWRVRRHQLSTSREKWLINQEMELRNQLDEMERMGSLGQDEPVARDNLPPSRGRWVRPDKLVIREENEESVDSLTTGDTDTTANRGVDGGGGAEVDTTRGVDGGAGTMGEVTGEAVGLKGEAAKGEVLEGLENAEETEMGNRDIHPSILSPLHSPPVVKGAHLADDGEDMADTSNHASVSNLDIYFPSPNALSAQVLDHSQSASPNKVALLDVTAQSAAPSFHVSEDLQAVLSAGKLSLANLPAARRSTKPVQGCHSSITTFDKDYLVHRSARRPNPNYVSPQKVAKRHTQNVTGFHISQQTDTNTDTLKLQTAFRKSSHAARMSASKQSDEPDSNVVRLEKFRVINKRGHASHSSIQDIMYYGSGQDDSTFEESFLLPIEPIRLEEIPEDFLHYDDENRVECIAEPSWPAKPFPSGTSLGLREGAVPLYEHVSLATLLQQSVAASLTAQISLSNQAVLSYFIVDLEFDKHMDILHDYLLLAKGEFSQAFTLPLFEKLHSNEGDGSRISTYVLTDTLSKALQHAPLKDNTFTDNINVCKGRTPRHMETYSLNAFSWLSLTYKVGWPMNVLITPEHISMYEKIFSFMISLKHISYLLADSWHSLRLSTHAHSISSESQQFRQLHLIRHDMQHFVKVIHGYLALQVTQVSWHQFQTELKTSVHHIDGLYDSHNRFINRCLLRCFLSQRVHQIKNVVDGIMKAIYKFHALLKLGNWELNEKEEYVHTEYDAIINIYLPFQEYTQFLNKVLSKMTEFDKNPHLRELQIMLNFNGYYNKQPVSAAAAQV